MKIGAGLSEEKGRENGLGLFNFGASFFEQNVGPARSVWVLARDFRDDEDSTPSWGCRLLEDSYQSGKRLVSIFSNSPGTNGR
jgi:hypothetical protein